MPFALWREAKLTPLHWAFVAFLAYALLSLTWAPAIEPWALQQLTVLAFGFAIGALISLRTIFIVVAFATLAFILYAVTLSPDGYSPMFLGSMASLLIVALYNERLWLLIPPFIPSMFLSHSRGDWATLACGILAVHVHKPLLFVILALLGALILTIHPGSSDIERLSIWHAAWLYFTPFGNGLGSFLSVWVVRDDIAVRFEYVHNDFIQLVFEFGFGAIPLLAIFAFGLAQPHHHEWPVLAAFSFMACFFFPLQTPVTAFIAALVLGKLSNYPITQSGAFKCVSFG